MILQSLPSGLDMHFGALTLATVERLILNIHIFIQANTYEIHEYTL